MSSVPSGPTGPVLSTATDTAAVVPQPAAAGSAVASGGAPGSAVPDGAAVTVRVDQDACTGDGLCVQYVREVFELDIDGLAYVRTPDGELAGQNASVPVPESLRLEVIGAARDCPGECIYVEPGPAGG